MPSEEIFKDVVAGYMRYLKCPPKMCSLRSSMFGDMRKILYENTLYIKVASS